MTATIMLGIGARGSASSGVSSVGSSRGVVRIVHGCLVLTRPGRRSPCRREPRPLPGGFNDESVRSVHVSAHRWIGAIGSPCPRSARIGQPRIWPRPEATLKLTEQCPVAGIAGALLPFAVWALLYSRGSRASSILPVWVGFCGALGWCRLLPVLGLRAEGETRAAHRGEWSGASWTWCSCSRGWSGNRRGIHSAAAICETGVSQQDCERCLDEARDAGRLPGRRSRSAGRELGVPELVELSSP